MYRYEACRGQVESALCDSIDTPRAMRSLSVLVSAVHQQIAAQPASIEPHLLRTVAQYVTRMLTVFGVIVESNPIGFPSCSDTAPGLDRETVLLPYVQALAQFREQTRDIARERKVGCEGNGEEGGGGYCMLRPAAATGSGVGPGPWC